MSFTLHTELRESVPEFTISCRTHGGPASTVGWIVDGVRVKELDIDHESSQVILDTSHNSVYDNRLRVRGRRAGTYHCRITGHFIDSSFLAWSSQTIAGIIIPYLGFFDFYHHYSHRRTYHSEGKYIQLSLYTCECDSVLGVTRRRCQWLYDLLPD